MKLVSLLQLRCPFCGEGKLFRGYFDNPGRCESCGYYFMRESGYFLPHVPIGYAATVFVALGSWPILRYVFRIQSPALTLSIMVAVALVFGVWFVRYSKAVWLAIDLTLHPPTAEDFTGRGRQP